MQSSAVQVVTYEFNIAGYEPARVEQVLCLLLRAGA